MTVQTKEIVYNQGQPVEFQGIRTEENVLILEGKFPTVARLKDEWYEGVEDPEELVNRLRKNPPLPDLFTFWQRLPDIEPKFDYYHELVQVAAVPTHSFDYWWTDLIKSDTRKKAKRAAKRGVDIREVKLTDEFVRGVMGVFNESPVRRGKPFWHYQKDFATVKEELERDLERAEFIGAYLEGELIGFVKMVYAEGRFGNPGLIISKIEHRDRYVNNALIAKSVELCERRGVPYMTYTMWRRGSQAAFLSRNGFEPVAMPRYWVPLTTRGRAALKLGLHHSWKNRIPDGLMTFLLEVRKKIYSTKYAS